MVENFEAGCHVNTPQGPGVVKTITVDRKVVCRMTSSGLTAKFQADDLTLGEAQGREALPVVDSMVPDEDIPMNPHVIRGVFGNGMTYYVQPNAEPPNRCELTVVIKVGSNHEEENERGIAHMLEHLTFRASKGGKATLEALDGVHAVDGGGAATRRSSGGDGSAGGGGEEFSLVHQLEANGIQFGAHQNAYTSFDETVYFLHVPLDQDEADDVYGGGGDGSGDNRGRGGGGVGKCDTPGNREKNTSSSTIDDSGGGGLSPADVDGDATPSASSSRRCGGGGGPRKRFGLLGSCMGVLSSLVLDARVTDGDVEAERSIVVEEWRQRQGANQRASDAYFKELLGGSKYASRMPIGLLDVIKQVPGATLRSFYAKFYDPRNMAVLCVGDFKQKDRKGDKPCDGGPDKPCEEVVVEMLREHFGSAVNSHWADADTADTADTGAAVPAAVVGKKHSNDGAAEGIDAATPPTPSPPSPPFARGGEPDSGSSSGLLAGPCRQPNRAIHKVFGKPSRCLVIRDPEATYTQASLTFKHKLPYSSSKPKRVPAAGPPALPRQGTVASAREIVVAQAALEALNNRLRRLSLQETPPFSSATCEDACPVVSAPSPSSSLPSPTDDGNAAAAAAAAAGNEDGGGQGESSHKSGVRATTVSVVAPEGCLRSGVCSAWREVRRAQVFGFSAKEVEVVVKAWEASLHSAWLERHQESSESLSEALKDHFLSGSAAPSPSFEIALENTLLPTLTPKDLQQCLQSLFPPALEKDVLCLVFQPASKVRVVLHVLGLDEIFGALADACLGGLARFLRRFLPRPLSCQALLGQLEDANEPNSGALGVGSGSWSWSSGGGGSGAGSGGDLLSALKCLGDEEHVSTKLGGAQLDFFGGGLGGENKGVPASSSSPSIPTSSSSSSSPEDITEVLLGTDHPLGWVHVKSQEEDGEREGWAPPQKPSRKGTKPSVGIVPGSLLALAEEVVEKEVEDASGGEEDRGQGKDKAEVQDVQVEGEEGDSDGGGVLVHEFVLSNGMQFTYRVNQGFLDDQVVVQGSACGGVTECVPLLKRRQAPGVEGKNDDDDESGGAAANDFERKRVPGNAKNEPSSSSSSPLSEEEVRRTLVACSHACHVAAIFGMFGLPKEQVVDVLNAKRVSLECHLGHYQRSVEGDCSPSDLETQFRLIHRLFTATVKPSAARLATAKQQLRDSLTHAANDPMTHFHASVDSLTFGSEHNPLLRPLTLQEVDSLDVDLALRVHHDCFLGSCPSEWRFVVSGSFDPTELRRLAVKYLACLPNRTANNRTAAATTAAGKSAGTTAESAGAGAGAVGGVGVGIHEEEEEKEEEDHLAQLLSKVPLLSTPTMATTEATTEAQTENQNSALPDHALVLAGKERQRRREARDGSCVVGEASGGGGGGCFLSVPRAHDATPLEVSFRGLSSTVAEDEKRGDASLSSTTLPLAAAAAAAATAATASSALESSYHHRVDLRRSMADPLTCIEMCWPIALGGDDNGDDDGGGAEIRLKDSILLDFAGSCLEQRLRNTLRLDMGAIYSVTVGANYSAAAPLSPLLPRQRLRGHLSVAFSCAPEQLQLLEEVVLKQVESMRRGGPTAAEVRAAVKTARTAREEQQRSNNYWCQALHSAYCSPRFKGNATSTLTEKNDLWKELARQLEQEAKEAAAEAVEAEPAAAGVVGVKLLRESFLKLLPPNAPHVTVTLSPRNTDYSYAGVTGNLSKRFGVFATTAAVSAALAAVTVGVVVAVKATRRRGAS